MGIKKYNPYTPSRRNMTGSDSRHPKSPFVYQRKSMPDATIRVRLLSDITAVGTDRNIESSISRETRTAFPQRSSASSTIRTGLRTSR